ncbi:RICIN domain-containing protein [Streptomyces guryensis]|uniref:RICIN domain-containing protein n=1 Tax=Streptomyces guryensis TaxID=2886947 RepID=A0A9Q3ZAM2_9ACTN|nr:RICIN domain-containing protein [Streptomyces guryensis]MCD9875490.1 RICIN domain-containing protein [Streptomyces guryensis]
MARADGTGNGVETGGGRGSGGVPRQEVHAGASDARLTELLRSSTPTVYPALQELRARHQPSVLAYARLCTASESAARQLAAQAFTLAARQTARGTEPLVPLRLQLLLLTGRTATSWVTGERAGGLDPGLLLLLTTAGPDAPVPPMLTAFRSLPSRAQGLVWYGVVEQESQDRTAALLGLTREDVGHETASALQAMGQACLRSRLAASADPRCGNFGRLIEESVRPDSPRTSTDLRAHMVHCVHCTAAYEELSALRDAPRTALAEGLLPWAGEAYTTSDAPRPEARADVTPDATRAKARADGSPWPPSPRLLLTSIAVGVALAPLLVFLLSQAASPASPPQEAAGAVRTPTIPPQVTVTATVSAVPSPSPSASATSRSPSPTRSRSSSPSKSPSKAPSKSPKPSASPTHAPNGTFAQIVNVASGRCLDVRDGDFENGTDVITAPCSSSRTQRWRVDSARAVVQSSADPEFCLDSRGDVDRGVGIWECGSVYGGNGQNLMFTVDEDGVIRPAVAIETALTPHWGDGLSLRPLDGGAEQRWRAGAS